MVCGEGSGDTVTLDVRGLDCPEPIVRLRAMLDGLAFGTRLQVQGDDPLTELDLLALCQRLGQPAQVVHRQAEQFTVEITRVSGLPSDVD